MQISIIIPGEINKNAQYSARPSPTPFHENLIQSISLVAEIRLRNGEPVGYDRQNCYTKNVYCQLCCRVEQENFLAHMHKQNYAKLPK